jgi:hypothetical protein
MALSASYGWSKTPGAADASPRKPREDSLPEKPAIQPEHIEEAFRRVDSALAIFFPYSPELSDEELEKLALSRLADTSGPEAMRGMLQAAGIGDETFEEFTQRTADTLAELSDYLEQLRPDIAAETKLPALAAALGLWVGVTGATLAAET